MPDVMDVEIMEDGVVKIKTTDISEANHVSADELLAEVTELMGGTRETTRVEHEFWKTREVVRRKGKIKIRRKA
ncbi:MAG: hypothetical protein ACYTBJ_00690 [Planctomycetota bacterium]|jgi:hypothetical protein